MDFLLLGPLEVLVDGRPVPLGGARQRALLALLLLHANEVVPRERLIDEVWGDDPPNSVGAALNVYVSKLRKLLQNGDGVRLVTRPNGYLLELAPERLDVHRFRRMAEDARGALARGEAESAAASLRTALALWRGPALADLPSGSIPQGEVEALEDLRLAALMDRIDAELALRGHELLVPELEALVGRHPLRERLRAQLMLALYRAGRQNEALEAYTHGRKALLELGLEPGTALRELERAILRQEPILDPPAPPRVGPPDEGGDDTVGTPKSGPRSTRRKLRIAAAALGAAAAVAASVAFVASRGAEPEALTAVSTESLAVVDPETNRLVAEVRLGARPADVVVGGGSVWVANPYDETLIRVDPETREVVRSIGLGFPPEKLAFGAGSVWAANSSSTQVLRVDADINEVTRRIDVRGEVLSGPSKGVPLPPPHGITFGAGSLWLAHGFGVVTRIDPTTSTVADRLIVGSGSGVGVGEGGVWAAGSARLGVMQTEVSQIDPRRSSVVRTIQIAGIGRGLPYGLAVGLGGVWLVHYYEEAVVHVDPRDGRVHAIIRIGRRPLALALGEGAVWTANSDGTLSRIDPETKRVAATIPLGRYPRAAYPVELAVGEGAVWVSMR